MSAGTRILDKMKAVLGFPPAVPASAVPVYVSLKNFNHLTIVLAVRNATGVTGSAITLNQATVVAGTDAKPLAFARAWSCLDTAASDTLTPQAVASNTFTTDATNAKTLLYVIEVDAADLDVTNGFCCVQVGIGNAAAATVQATYLLSGARYSGNVALMPSAIVN